MNSKKKIKSIPPFECIENGCKERSEKCKNCRWSHCVWFYPNTNDDTEFEN